MSAGRRRRRPTALIHLGPSGGVADLGRLVGAIAVSAILAGCMARPVGDFGRAQPSFTHDVAMSGAGRLKASQRGEPVSDFNQTDQEREMHDRVWRFLVAPHAKDWYYDHAVEMQRTRNSPARDQEFHTDRYYNWLRDTAYRSSRTRYATVGSDVLADLETLPTTFAAICAVIEIDRQRAVALSQLANLDPSAAENVAARKWENDTHISWFVRAVTYRYKSYSFALDNLLVETPHEQSLAVDEHLRHLGREVDRANRHDFCGDGAGLGSSGGTVVIPSRFHHSGDGEVVLPK